VANNAAAAAGIMRAFIHFLICTSVFAPGLQYR
jgi:hypothetical protein